MTGKRQLHLGKLRQRENIIGDIGGNEIADACRDREGFTLQPIARRNLGAPGFVAAAGDRGLGKQGEAIGHALEGEARLGDVPAGAVDLIDELDRSIADQDTVEAGDRGARPLGASHRAAQEIDDRGALGFRGDLLNICFLAGFAGGPIRSIRCAMHIEAELEAAVQRAPDNDARADQFASVDTNSRLGRPSNDFALGIGEFDIAQPEMRHAGLGVALDQHALKPDAQAPEIGIDLCLDAVTHKIQRNRSGHQPDEKCSARDDDDRHETQKNQRRRFPKSPQTAQPRLKISPIHRHASTARTVLQTVRIRIGHRE